MDMHDPVFADLTERLPHTSWTRKMTANERAALFRRALGPGLLANGKARDASEEEVRDRGTFLAYRWLRWLLQGLGWASIADPLSFVTEVQGRRPNAGFGAKGMWDSPVPQQPMHVSSSTLPGVYALGRELAGSPTRGLYLQPPAARAVRSVFLGTLQAGIESLKMRQSTPDHAELGLYLIDPALYGAQGGYLNDDGWDLLCSRFPTPEEILEFEQGFMTTLAEALSQTNEDELRIWMRQQWHMTDYESFSIAQTAKAWASAMRPIDMEVERRVQLRRLEGASERARLAGDHRAEIMASTQASRILGLAQNGPIDADEAAATAALTAHEEKSELDGEVPSLEQWRESKGLPQLRSVDQGPDHLPDSSKKNTDR